jgi:hypothetical protein
LGNAVEPNAVAPRYNHRENHSAVKCMLTDRYMMRGREDELKDRGAAVRGAQRTLRFRVYRTESLAWLLGMGILCHEARVAEHRDNGDETDDPTRGSVHNVLAPSAPEDVGSRRWERLIRHPNGESRLAYGTSARSKADRASTVSSPLHFFDECRRLNVRGSKGHVG